MASKFVIRDLFKLPGEVTVLACENVGGDGLSSFKGCNARIHNDSELRQSIFLNGERKMLNQTRPNSFRAAETLENVQLSTDEAQSGVWFLSIDN